MPSTFNALDIAGTDLGAAIEFSRKLGRRAAGLQEPFDAPWGMRYATVADPAGDGIDLYADRPAS